MDWFLGFLCFYLVVLILKLICNIMDLIFGDDEKGVENDNI